MQVSLDRKMTRDRLGVRRVVPCIFFAADDLNKADECGMNISGQ